MRNPVALARGTGEFGRRMVNLPRIRFWALIASVIWLVVVAGYAIGFISVVSESQQRGTVVLDLLFFVVVLLLPLLLIWLSAWVAEELERQRTLIAELSGWLVPLGEALQDTRRALETGPVLTRDDLVRAMETGSGQTGHTPEIAVALSELTSAQNHMLQVLEGLIRSDPVAEPAEAVDSPEPAPVAEPEYVHDVGGAGPEPAREPDDAQASLPLLPDEEDPQRPNWPDLVRALDFPKDAQDFEGFRALQAVVRYRPLAQMLQSAEDVLTLLSQEGVYMDDLLIEMGSPDDWRRFMQGQRGPSVGGVYGIRDENALELARALMKSDTIFRDTALFFQRRFDRVLAEFGRDAGDARILELADTRSGRAYMLMTKLNGTFD